jgi:hypothetical protein
MVKSFKKVIACLLAVLMVCFSLPFTAFAAVPKDWQPNLTLRFGTLSDVEADDFTSDDFSGGDLSTAGLFGPTLDYTGYVDKATGAYNVTSLSLDRSKITDSMLESAEREYSGSREGTTKYTEGMYFTMTFQLENVDVIGGVDAKLSYSGNITPIMIWEAGAKSKTAEGAIGSYEEYLEAKDENKYCEALSGLGDEGVNGVLSGNCSETFYDEQLNASESSYANVDGGMYIACIGSEDQYDISTVTEKQKKLLVDPETGETGYDSAGKMIVVTYMFQITGDISEDNPITIAVPNENPDDDALTVVNKSITSCDTQKNANPYDLCTYNHNFVGTDLKDSDVENDGSCNMYFMGYNCTTGKYLNASTDTHDHSASTQLINEKAATCQTDGYTGDLVCTEDQTIVTAGETIPASSAYHSYKAEHVDATCQSNGYTQYVCEYCDDVKAEVEYDDPATTLAHDFGEYTSDGNATCTEDGTKTATCNVGKETDTVTDEGSALGHDFSVLVTPQVDATEDAAGTTAVYKCSRCDETTGGDPIKQLDHTHSYTEVETPATCTADAYVTKTCVKGDDTQVITKEGTALGHQFTNYVSNNDATCTADGTKTAKCDRCDENDTVTDEGSALGHKFTNYVSNNDATCEADGTKTAKCDRCDENDTVTDEGSQLSHEWVEIEAEVPATQTTDGKTAVEQCKNGCNQTRGGEVIPATGIIVTLDDTYAQYGDVTDYEYGKNTVKYLSTVTLTAAPIGDASFVGWEVSGKQVSTDTTYTFTATSDVTVTPIFADTKENITVVFLDKYNNVTYSFVGTPADFAAEMKSAIPQGTNYPGYSFDGWELSDEEIQAITESTTVNAKYSVVGNGYTVTLNGKGTIDGENVTEKSVTYDTSVTVTSEGATAWEVDGVKVAYGSSYTFFVGADITVTPVTDASVTAKPEVGMVNTTVSDATNKTVNYLATMSVADGYKLLDHGFVYVADNTDAATVTLEKVGTKASNGKAIKKITAGATGSNQFALNYSVKSTQYATVAAYIVYQAADGTVTTQYTSPTVFDYSTIQ